MTAPLLHRGPDGGGYYVDPDLPVFLGHRRLAVIDASGGHQPMWNEDGQVCVVFNGEIYNHQELRRILVDGGHTFRSDHSDTEVLIHGYEEWGSDLPLKLNGMFAFAIFDRPRRRIFLARDRFGEKPLYYSVSPGLFAFASEVAAVTKHRAITAGIDYRSLQKFFGYGYLPAPNTIFQGCHKLPGGHCAIYDIDSGGFSAKPYWRFRIEPDESLTDADIPRLSEELGDLIIQAVGKRMISDVPLGVFLSGGIDSSTIVAAAMRHSPQTPPRTFTIGFNEVSFDESAAAASLSGYFGTAHHEKLLDMEAVKELIPDVLSRMDEPLGDASLLPTYLLSAFTREHVTVALSGDGGDELFAGYDTFLALKPAKYYSRTVPRWLHCRLRRLADLLPISTKNMSFDFKVRRMLAGLSHPESLWNAGWMAPLDACDFNDLFEQPLEAEDLYSEAIDLWQQSPSRDVVDRSLEYFTNLYLPDNILTKVDRASMMVSLETRAVFLDKDIAEFCMKLPNRFKLRGRNRKFLLKQAVKNLLPAAVLSRRKKGFGIPLAHWLRSTPAVPPMAPVAEMNVAEVETRWNGHRSNRRDHRLFLWNWLALQYADHGNIVRQTHCR